MIVDPAARAAEDAASDRWPTDRELLETEGWTDEEIRAYHAAVAEERRLREPARAPLPWPSRLACIALDTALTAVAEASRRTGRWRHRTVEVGVWLVTLFGIRDRLERRYARRLGLTTVADHPGVPLRWPALGGNQRATVSLRASSSRESFFFGALMSTASVFVTALVRSLRRRGRPPVRWEIFLANQLSFSCCAATTGGARAGSARSPPRAGSPGLGRLAVLGDRYQR